MIAYIAGPMSGIEDYNKPAFDKAEEELKAVGIIVLNPAIMPVGMKQHQYMPICLAMLEQADAIYVLKGFQNSRGAMLELAYAEKQGKAIIYEGSVNWNRAKEEGL